MSTAVVTERIVDASPRLTARMAGVLYVLEVPPAGFAQFFVLGRLVVHGDAATTATNILANEPLFWAGFTAALLAIALHLAYTVLFYDVLRPVNRSLALLAAFFMLVGCAIWAVGSLFQLAALLVVSGGSALSAFSVEQAQALALLMLNVNAQAFDIYLVFFGFWLLLIGYLIVRSTFLPRLLGVLVAVASVSYLILLSPPLATALYPFYLAPAAPGEISLMLWLLVMGVNAERWKEQASAAGAALRA